MTPKSCYRGPLIGLVLIDRSVIQDTGNSYCVLAEEGRPLFVDHQDLLVDWHSMDDPISKGALLVPYILMLCGCDLYESDFCQGTSESGLHLIIIHYDATWPILQ